MLKYNSAPDNIEEIPCLLVPNQGFRLVLPNTAIAEVIGWHIPEPQHTANSDWLLGFFEWREQRLPLLSIHIAEQTPAPHQPFSKIAILNTVSDDLGFQYYGLAICGIPKLVRVNRDETSICATEANPSVKAPELSLVTSGINVMFSGENAWLPDLDQVERQLSKLFR